MDHSPYGSRIAYPRLPDPLTEGDLARLFTVSAQEDHWARTVARKGPSLAVYWPAIPIADLTAPPHNAHNAH